MVYGCWNLEKRIGKRPKAKGSRQRSQSMQIIFAILAFIAVKTRDLLSLFICLTIVLGDILKHSCAEMRDIDKQRMSILDKISYTNGTKKTRRIYNFGLWYLTAKTAMITKN